MIDDMSELNVYEYFASEMGLCFLLRYLLELFLIFSHHRFWLRNETVIMKTVLFTVFVFYPECVS